MKYLKKAAAILVTTIIVTAFAGIWLARYFVERDLKEARRKPVEKGQKCGGGFHELSPEFKNQYSKQMSKMTDMETPVVPDEGIPFYGFVYAPTRRDLKAGETESYPGCAEITSLTPDDVFFAGPEVNTVLRQYISAETFNERSLNRAFAIVQGGASIVDAKIVFCVTLDCNETQQLGGYQTFNYANEADLEYAHISSDTALGARAIGKLRETPFRENSRTLIDENTLSGLLISARRTALVRSK